MGRFDDLSGQTFGIWKVIAFDHMKQNGTDGTRGMSYYRCECSKCGQIRLKARSELIQNNAKSHYTCEVKRNARAI